MADDDDPGAPPGRWARRLRRSWHADEVHPEATPAAREIDRLERELLAERRKVVERDIEIADLWARLDEATNGPPADGGT
jgi:hypothetical protein